MSRYNELRKKQFLSKRNSEIALSNEELEYIKNVQAIVGYKVKLHLPLGSIFILGADDAEAIYSRIINATTP